MPSLSPIAFLAARRQAVHPSARARAERAAATGTALRRALQTLYGGLSGTSAGVAEVGRATALRGADGAVVAEEDIAEKRGQIYFYYSNFSDCAHAELLKANNSLNHAPLPRHREIPLRHLNWSLHARKIRVEKINLSPLWSYEECSGGSVKITSAGAESLTVPMRPTPILMAQP